jgi:F0F1-type ATP synthase membrane subunit b/b'
MSHILSTLVLLSISSAFAAGDGGHHGGSITDLIAPAINVIILFGVLAWKIKGPLSDHFKQKSKEVANTIERADIKSKEAQIMLDNEKRKLATVDSEVASIKDKSAQDIVVFEKNLLRETEEKTHKLKVDAESKIKADKKSILDQISSELLTQVISKTKSTIKGNKDYQNKVSEKLLSGLKQ